MIKKVISTVLLGATLAVPFTAVSLMTNETKAEAAVGNIFNVSETSYDSNSGWYKFKFNISGEAWYTSVKIGSSHRYGYSEETVYLSSFYEVISGSKNEKMIGNKLLRREGNQYILEIKDDEITYAVSAKFTYNWRWVYGESDTYTVYQR